MTISDREVEALEELAGRKPATETEARLPRSSASLLEDKLYHWEVWCSAIKIRLALAARRRAVTRAVSNVGADRGGSGGEGAAVAGGGAGGRWLRRAE